MFEIVLHLGFLDDAANCTDIPRRSERISFDNNQRVGRDPHRFPSVFKMGYELHLGD